MSVAEIIAPIIEETYGSHHKVDALADRIEWSAWDSRGREYGIACACWSWFPGDLGAALDAAARIEKALRDAGF